MTLSRKLMGINKNVAAPVEIIGAKSTTIAQGATLTSVAHEPGDYIIFMNGNNGGTSIVAPPPLASGYTDIVSTPALRSVRVQYKVAATSGTETVTSDDYGLLIIVRYAAGIGQSGTIALTTTSSIVTLPSLSGLNVSNSLVLAGTYFPGTSTSNDLTSVTSPFVLKTSVANNSSTLFSYAAIENNAEAAYSGKTATSGAFIYNVTWAVEILGG